LKRDTLIKHKEVVIVCKESEPISKSYNDTLTTPKNNTTIKIIVSSISTKSSLVYISCGITNHTIETCHKQKKEILTLWKIMFAIIKLPCN
jgi:hypothetical protein